MRGDRTHYGPLHTWYLSADGRRSRNGWMTEPATGMAAVLPSSAVPLPSFRRNEACEWLA